MSVVSNLIELSDGGDSEYALYNLPFLLLHCVILANSAGSQLIFSKFLEWRRTPKFGVFLFCFVLVFWCFFFLFRWLGFFLDLNLLCEHLAKHWKDKVFEKS